MAAVQKCTCFTLRKAARAVTQVYDEILRPTGLRSTQFSLLMVVRGSRKVSMTDLADRAVMDRTTLKRNLELLEKEGLVRIQSGADARVREVTLTPAAEKKLAEALPYWIKAHTRVMDKLGEGRSGRLLNDLSAAIAAAQPGS
jgi:DNA-binding MarR family transcriptional regulator